VTSFLVKLAIILNVIRGLHSDRDLDCGIKGYNTV